MKKPRRNYYRGFYQETFGTLVAQLLVKTPDFCARKTSKPLL